MANKLYLLGVISCLCWHYIAHSSVINPVITVKSIECVAPTENSGDELYFDILEIRHSTRPRRTRIPKFPRYYLSTSLAKLKEFVIWKGSLSTNEKTTLYISLIENDAPPLDPDDFIGGLKVIVVNQPSSYKISVVNRNEEKDSTVIQGSDHTYESTFMKNGSEYRIKLSFQIKKTRK